MDCPGPVHVVVAIRGLSKTTSGKDNVVRQMRVNVPSFVGLDTVELEIDTTGEGTVNKCQVISCNKHLGFLLCRFKFTCSLELLRGLIRTEELTFT